MRKMLFTLLALIAGSTAFAQTTSTCTTAQTISLQSQKYSPVYAITLTSGDTCALTFEPILDPNAAQSITLKVIQSASAPYNGSLSGGTWPNGIPSVPQTAGATIFARCEVDTSGAYCFQIAPVAPPQVTVLTSGSGTYTTPPGTISLTVEMVGAGGGGAGAGLDYSVLLPDAWSSSVTYPVGFGVSYGGSIYACLQNAQPQSNCPAGAEPDTSPSYWAPMTLAGSGSAGAASTFGSLTANGGGGATAQSGTAGVSGNPGAGGSASGGDLNMIGSEGGSEGGGLAAAGAPGPFGGTSLSGGPPANSGAGGAGGTPQFGWNDIGAGGGAGGYLKKAIAPPAPTYPYSVGTGGAGGSAASCAGISGCGTAGQAGAAGLIIVTAYQ